MIEIIKLSNGGVAIYRAEQVNSGLVLTRREIEELQTTLSEVLQCQED